MNPMGQKRYRKRICFPGLSIYLILLLFFFLCFSPAYAAATDPDQGKSTVSDAQKTEKPADETEPAPVTAKEKPSDEYGDVTAETATSGEGPVTAKEKPSDEYGDVTAETATSGEGPSIADPIEPWNRAMYHFNDKFYFWLLKPVAQGYKYVIPEEIRGMFSSFYENIKMPIRFVNNLLQGKLAYAGIELVRFMMNSTAGVLGFYDFAKAVEIPGHDADFGQTLGKYGVGFGFYIVWPILGPSSPRDSVGWAADCMLKPTNYVSSEWISPEGVGLYAHEKVNYYSFHIGDYETLKGAAIDPYIAMRDAYIQYRKKLIEQ
jgi:phospholipid-binding lipoprotein MlaA